MIRGLYAAASGMMAQMARQDVYANNLANVNSVGFRREQTVLGQFAANLAAAESTSATASGGTLALPAGLDLSQGPLCATSRNLDLALSGNGFFAIQTPRGLAYTRDGRFSLNAQNQLVNAQGYPVLGQQGPLAIPEGDFSVNTSGQITAGGKTIGTLRIETPVAPRPLGNACFAAASATPARGFTVNQGMIEQANVNAMQETGRMMDGYRYYEANANALRCQDETLSTLMKVVQ